MDCDSVFGTGQELKLFLAWTGSAMHAGANAKAGIELLFAWIRSLQVYALWYI